MVSRVKFKVPSKTFLVGEYSALRGAPALLLAHGPYFEIEFKKTLQTKNSLTKTVNPFHPDSPAGIWLDIHEDVFANVGIEFQDPYKGAGGFGASTAQFIATYLYVLAQQNMLRSGVDLSDLQKWAITEDYKNLFEDSEVTPSGYDVLSQLTGGLSSISFAQHNISSLSWPFKDIDILVYKTKHKVNTHEHLNQFQISSEVQKFLEISSVHCIEAINKKNPDIFFAQIKEFSYILNKAKLMDPKIFALTEIWNKTPGVFVSRGCGAMGVDVFTAFVKKDFMPDKNLELDLLPVWRIGEGFANGVTLESSMDSAKQDHI